MSLAHNKNGELAKCVNCYKLDIRDRMVEVLLPDAWPRDVDEDEILVNISDVDI